VYSAVVRPPPPHPPEPPKRAPYAQAYIQTYHAGPYAPTHRLMPSAHVSLHYTPGAICTLPPPYLYTFEICRAFSLSASPPSKRERDVQHVQVKGEGRGTRAETSLFPVSADRMKSSNKLEMGSVEAHGHTGSPPPARASVAEVAHESAYSYRQARGHPPSHRGTDSKIIGRHNNGLHRHTSS
jgi:hypothetical protein